MGGRFVAGQQVGHPPFGARDVLVTLGQDIVGDQHVTQVVRGPRRRMGVQCLVVDGQPTGGQVGEDACSLTFSEPVQRGAGHRGRGDRLDDRDQSVGGGWCVAAQ